MRRVYRILLRYIVALFLATLVIITCAYLRLVGTSITSEEIAHIYSKKPSSYEELYNEVRKVRPYFGMPSPRHARDNPSKYFVRVHDHSKTIHRLSSQFGPKNGKRAVYEYSFWGVAAHGQIFGGTCPYFVYFDEDLNIRFWCLDKRTEMNPREMNPRANQ